MELFIFKFSKKINANHLRHNNIDHLNSKLIYIIRYVLIDIGNYGGKILLFNCFRRSVQCTCVFLISEYMKLDESADNLSIEATKRRRWRRHVVTLKQLLWLISITFIFWQPSALNSWLRRKTNLLVLWQAQMMPTIKISNNSK